MQNKGTPQAYAQGIGQVLLLSHKRRAMFEYIERMPWCELLKVDMDPTSTDAEFRQTLDEYFEYLDALRKVEKYTGRRVPDAVMGPKFKRQCVCGICEGSEYNVTK